MARTKDGHADKGVSLARGPALILGSILVGFGLLLFLKAGDTPTGTFPDGTQNGPTFIGFETNGWTAWFTVLAGALLLFGAAQHLLAKTMSLIVGLALGACSVIALVDGDDVLGLAAANGWTKLGWGVASAFLLINTLLPRKGGKDKHTDDDRDRDVARAPVAPPRREPVAPQRETAVPREPVATRRVPDEDVHTTRVEETTDRGRLTDDRDSGNLRDRPLGGTDRADGSVADDRLRDQR